MSEITWDELTDYEREVLALMPDFWTHHTMLPLLVQDRMLSTVLPLAMRGVLIECYTDDASYRRTETGRALVEAARIVHNENGVPVALHDGWQHVGDYPPALSPVQQAVHWAKNNGGIMPAQTLKAAVLELCAERDALLAENERIEGYAAFCYSCAKCKEEPMTYEEYLAALEAESDGE